MTKDLNSRSVDPKVFIDTTEGTEVTNVIKANKAGIKNLTLQDWKT